jgi:CRISPR-associated endonuclease Csn1
LKLTDLEKVKGADRNAAVIASLRNWIEAGKPESALPLSPKGDPISKVTLLTNKKPELIVREGAVDRGEMARVDVFRKKSAAGAWQHYVIPIYPHQIAREVLPPNRAVQANTPEDKWPLIDDTYEFMWSLTPMNYLEIETANGEHMEGYYRGASRSTGAFEISNNRNSNDKKSGIGARTLKTLNKYTIDRLGQRHLVKSELRTWRGKVCISASPQG